MKIEKLSIIVLIFFVSMSLFSMERRRAFEGDYIDGMSRDPLYNELIRSICDEKDLNRVEGCLIIRRSELLEEAREKRG